jgi:hypothetical protein
MVTQYFQIRKWAFLEVLIMICIAFGIGILINEFGNLNDYHTNINSTIINLTGILIGFTITSISLISSSSNEGIKQLKEKKTDQKVDGNEVSYYRVLLSRMSFTIFIELLLLCTSILIAFRKFNTINFTDYVIIDIQMLLLLYTIYLTLNNTSSLYHTLFFENKKPNHGEK